MVDVIISHEEVLKTLKKSYEEVSDGEFIVARTPVWDQGLKLVVRKIEDKSEIKQLEEEIKKEQAEVEKDIKKFAVIFYDNHIIFMTAKGLDVEKLRKDLSKISPAFIKKYKKFLKNPGDPAVWEELFDRSDIIEEFYRLYIKAREKILENVDGIYDDKKKEEFADNLLMQLLIIWYLQEKGFLNGDTGYLVNRFKDYRDRGFDSYYKFLKELFEVMMSEPNDGIYHVDDRFGKIVVTGPAPFLNGEFEDATLPDDVFCVDGKTDELKRIEPKKANNVPILNLFESRDWTEGNIDEFVLGAIFEKLMTAEDRKEKGAFYTPEPITEYICNNTIKPYLVDRINEEKGTDYESLEEFFEKDGSEEHWEFLFNLMQDLRILDPAVGSGHFLETAINVLVEIYEKIIEKANNLGFSYDKFTITSANEKGELVKKSLLAIEDEEERKLKLKFHIILSRNIYGVDILPSAIRVARARMFMSLAKHFNVRKGTHIRFPNVHFNLRVGNSLIGFANRDAFENVSRQMTLEGFFTDKGEKLDLELKGDLRDYIMKMDAVLETRANPLFDEVKSFYSQELNQQRLLKVLGLRSDLIKIMLASLNTDYAVKLKKFIDDLTKRFNLRLNKEFLNYLESKGVEISEDQLEKIGFFHWIMEFSEVFLDMVGFDVVVGNPPYGFRRALSKFEKNLLRKIGFQFSSGDMAEVFTKRSLYFTKQSGYFSFIIPKKSIYGDSWSNLRKFLRKYYLISIADAGKAFEQVKLEMAIFILKKVEKRNLKLKSAYYSKEIKVIEDIGEFVDSNDDEQPFYIYSTGVLNTIYEFIKHFPKVGDMDLIIKIGQSNITDLMNSEKIHQKDVPILKGDDIGRYKIKNIHYLPFAKVECNYLRPKLIFQKIIAHIQNPVPHIELMGVYDSNGIFTLHDTSVMYYKRNYIGGEFSLASLLGLLNSSFASWFYYNYTYNRAIRTMDFIDYYAKQLPTPKELTKSSVVANLAIYLSILSQSSQDYLKDPLDRLLDCVIYEFYFKQKFIEDSKKALEEGRELIYPHLENGPFLIDLIAEYLKSVEYDRWYKLYWKKQIDEKLTKEEEEELEKLEKENLGTIQEVYESIKQDTEIIGLIERIRSHEWVKVIEGGN